MTILQIMQDVTDMIGLRRLSTVTGGANATARQLLRLAHDAGRDVIRDYYWPELNRTHTITLVADQQAYALPTDLDWTVRDTHWNRDQQWELIGPQGPQEWQLEVSGITQTGPRTRWRVRGIADNEFNLYPTPGSGDAGETLAFEYQSINWVRPRTWAEGQDYTAGSYTFYNGNYYTNTNGGTTGATAPTHTTGDSSDGGVTWTYFDGVYNRFLADTDVSILDPHCLAKEIECRWRKLKMLDYRPEDEMEARSAWKKSSVRKKGSRAINRLRTRTYSVGPHYTLPDTGYGGI